MSNVSDSLRRKLDLVLEETCRNLPHGGDHDTRRRIAEQLLAAALAGQTTLGELGIIARKAVSDLKPDD